VRAIERMGVLMSIAAIVAGCHLMPAVRPAIECIDLPAAECERQAAAIIADARRDTPDKRIVSITLSAHDGGEVHYDDGTAMIWTP
jgi:hypothetical protein